MRAWGVRAADAAAGVDLSFSDQQRGQMQREGIRVSQVTGDHAGGTVPLRQ